MKCTLEVHVDHKSPPCQKDDVFWKSVTYIAEIRESLYPSLSSVRFVSRQDIESQLRSKTQKTKPLLEGIPTSVSTEITSSTHETKIVEIEFNSNPKAWHYGKIATERLNGVHRADPFCFPSGWTSHKCRTHVKHCVDVLVLVDNGSAGYFIAGSYKSPEFEIGCTKTDIKRGGSTSLMPVMSLEPGVKKGGRKKRKSVKNACEKPTEKELVFERDETEEEMVGEKDEAEKEGVCEVLASMPQQDVVEV